MKKLILFACTMLALSACTPKEDPLAAAIVSAMTREIDEPCQIRVTNLQKIDSTDFATEFGRRIGIYDARLKQNAFRMEKYLRDGMRNNATRMFHEIQKDTKIFNELNVLKEMMGDDTLKVAYYDYSYTYGGKVGSQKLPSKQAFATVTPDGRVLTYAAKLSDLHKATGLVIPGYKELLDSFKDEVKEEDE